MTLKERAVVQKQKQPSINSWKLLDKMEMDASKIDIQVCWPTQEIAFVRKSMDDGDKESVICFEKSFGRPDLIVDLFHLQKKKQQKDRFDALLISIASKLLPEKGERFTPYFKKKLFLEMFASSSEENSTIFLSYVQENVQRVLQRLEKERKCNLIFERNNMKEKITQNIPQLTEILSLRSLDKLKEVVNPIVEVKYRFIIFISQSFLTI